METEERKEGRTEAARQDWDREKNPFLEIAVKMRGEVLGDDGVFFTMDGRRVMEFAANIEAVGEWIRRRCEQERELLKANIARVRELEGLLGGAADTVLRCAIIDRKRVPVLHGRVAKTPDGRIHEIVQPATMMHEQEPVTKCNGLPVAYRETQSAVHNEPCECQTAHNAAKMSEALEWATSTIDVSQEVLDETEDWENEVVCWVLELQKKAHAALAAPPRNCDRPECSTPKGAAQEWAKHCSAFADKDEECAGCLHQHQEHEAPCVVEWLLAPAAREGGDHAEAR